MENKKILQAKAVAGSVELQLGIAWEWVAESLEGFCLSRGLMILPSSNLKPIEFDGFRSCWGILDFAYFVYGELKLIGIIKWQKVKPLMFRAGKLR